MTTDFQQALYNFRTELEALSAKEKKPIDKEQFPHLLSALPCLLAQYPLFSDTLKREDLSSYLKERFQIHDRQSAIETIHSFVFSNAQAQFEYCLAYWEGKQSEQLEKMNEKAKEFFMICQKFARTLYPEVLERGFCAFDFGEAIRIAKECYSAHFLDEKAYRFMINDIANRAFYAFDNWEDYALSYICGGMYYLFVKSGGKEAYAKQMCETLMGGIRTLYEKDGLWATSAWLQGKRYFAWLKETKKVIEQNEAGLVSDRISVEQRAVNYLVRVEPVEGTTDSGWQFFHGDESREYLEDVSHLQLFDLNVICNMEPALIPLLNAPVGSAYRRRKDGTFEKVK